MKRISSIGCFVLLGSVLALSMSLIGSCGRKNDNTTSTMNHVTPPLLLSIDSIMGPQPDTALFLLATYLTDKDTLVEDHYAQLLLAELLYKKGCEQINRAEVLQAVDYFDSLCRSKDLAPDMSTIVLLDARSHYVNGIGYYESGHVEEACSEYIRAVRALEIGYQDEALGGQAASLMALANVRLGELFSEQYMIEPSIVCFKEALAFAKVAQTSPFWVPNCLYWIGKQYGKNMEFDSSTYYYRQALAQLPDSNNLLYRDIVSTMAIQDHRCGKDVGLAVRDVRRMMDKADSDAERLTRKMIIGGMYFDENLFDSALVYFKPVFDNKVDLFSSLLAAEQLRIIYDSLGDKAQADEYARFLADHRPQEAMSQAKVSQLNGQFQQYLKQKSEDNEAKEKKRNLRNAILVTLSLALAAGFLIIIMVRRKNMKALKEQEEKTQKLLDQERQSHRMKQAALSGRLRKSNEARRKLEEQIQMQNVNSQEETSPSIPFEEERVCRLILERVNEGMFKSKVDYLLYKDYALSKEQIAALRDAVNRHYNQFTTRIAETYPALTKSDLDYCCLYMLGLTEADVAALMQRAYNTVCDRSRKMKSIFGSSDALATTIRNMANDTIIC